MPFNGGAEGTRTPDPHTASVVRYQLRHSPLRKVETTAPLRQRLRQPDSSGSQDGSRLVGHRLLVVRASVRQSRSPDPSPGPAATRRLGVPPKPDRAQRQFDRSNTSRSGSASTTSNQPEIAIRYCAEPEPLTTGGRRTARTAKNVSTSTTNVGTSTVSRPYTTDDASPEGSGVLATCHTEPAQARTSKPAARRGERHNHPAATPIPTNTARTAYDTQTRRRRCPIQHAGN